MPRGINKVILIGNVTSAIEHAKSHRKFAVAREALLKAFDDLQELSRSFKHDTQKLQNLRAQLQTAFKAIFKKQVIQPQTNNQNSATNLLLRNKLKPTSDGKDASIDTKATNRTYGFFINYWNPIYAQPQNRTLN